MKDKFSDIKNNADKKAELSDYVIACAESVGMEDSEQVEKSFALWQLFITVFEAGHKKAKSDKDLKTLQDACQAEFLSIEDVAEHIRYLRQEVFMKGAGL